MHSEEKLARHPLLKHSLPQNSIKQNNRKHIMYQLFTFTYCHIYLHFFFFLSLAKPSSPSLELHLQPDYTIQSLTVYALFILLVWLILKLPTRTTTHHYLSDKEAAEMFFPGFLGAEALIYTNIYKISDFLCGRAMLNVMLHL